MKISISKQEYEINPEDIKAVERFLASFVPGFIKESFGGLQDKVSGWRVRNTIKTLMKTKELVESSGLTQKELSGKFFVQTLSKISIEDNESLQNKWAILLTNTSTGKARADIKFINILSELEADEVRLLDILYVEQLTQKKDKEYIFSTERFSKMFNLDLQIAKIMVDNFYRLCICESPAMTSISTGSKDTHPSIKTNNIFVFTDLGLAFLFAVTI